MIIIFLRLEKSFSEETEKFLWMGWEIVGSTEGAGLHLAHILKAQCMHKPGGSYSSTKAHLRSNVASPFTHLLAIKIELFLKKPVLHQSKFCFLFITSNFNIINMILI